MVEILPIRRKTLSNQSINDIDIVSYTHFSSDGQLYRHWHSALFHNYHMNRHCMHDFFCHIIVIISYTHFNQNGNLSRILISWMNGNEIGDLLNSDLFSKRQWDRQNIPTTDMQWNMCCTVIHAFLARLSWKLKWAFLITFRPSSVCLSVRPSVCKLFTFSSSSPEPLVQFQPNLAQSILG